MRALNQRGDGVSLPRVDELFVLGDSFARGVSVPRFSFGRELALSCDGISELDSELVLLDDDELSVLRAPWLASDGGTAVDAASVLLFGSRFVLDGVVAFLSR